jgi:hypothetical protein
MAAAADTAAAETAGNFFDRRSVVSWPTFFFDDPRFEYLMAYSPLTLSRRHVLGSLYGRCDRMTKDVPVYLNDVQGEKLGVVDESLGQYADAFTFHLSEEICKRMAGGQYTYTFDYHFSEAASRALSAGRRRIRLISVFLTMRKGYDKPLPKLVKENQESSESV